MRHKYRMQKAGLKIEVDNNQLVPTQQSVLTMPVTQTPVNPDYNKILENSNLEAGQNWLAPRLSAFLAKRSAGLPTNPFKSTGNEGTDSNPMGRGPIDNTGQPEKSPEKPKNNPFLMLRGLSTVGSLLSNIVARKVQDKYDYLQQTALGQMNSIPINQFQPTYNNMYGEMGGNPFSAYAKYGGNLKNIIKDYNKFSNNAQMDMGDGKLDNQGLMMKGGTYDLPDEYVHDMLRQLLHMGRMAHNNFNKGTKPLRGKKMGGKMDMDDCHHCMDTDMSMKRGGIHIKKENRGKFTASAKAAGMGVQEFARHVLANKEDYSSTQVKRANFARNASKWRPGGSLTPNKARMILHDGTVHGKPITDKQRRFFGAMSKGHTNFRGK